jgi:hypothetical protein
LSPRFVPNDIFQVTAVPAPAKAGAAHQPYCSASRWIVNREAMANPEV